MLQLAQVQKNVNSGQFNLTLVAHQITDNLWEINNKEIVILDNLNRDENFDLILTEGLLILVELDENNKIINIKSANQWILELVKKYLTYPIFDQEFVKKEQDKVEKWRQEMALQSQDLTRRNLELETRKEQLEELEEKLKQKERELNFLQKSSNK